LVDTFLGDKPGEAMAMAMTDIRIIYGINRFTTVRFPAGRIMRPGQDKYPKYEKSGKNRANQMQI
jgi:hypothetical protein